MRLLGIMVLLAAVWLAAMVGIIRTRPDETMPLVVVRGVGRGQRLVLCKLNMAWACLTPFQEYNKGK